MKLLNIIKQQINNAHKVDGLYLKNAIYGAVNELNDQELMDLFLELGLEYFLDTHEGIATNRITVKAMICSHFFGALAKNK